MTCYRLEWYIDIEADSPREAAEIALGIQRDPESIATVFTVRGPSGAVCIDAASGETLPSDALAFHAAAGE